MLVLLHLHQPRENRILVVILILLLHLSPKQDQRHPRSHRKDFNCTIEKRLAPKYRDGPAILRELNKLEVVLETPPPPPPPPPSSSAPGKQNSRRHPPPPPPQPKTRSRTSSQSQKRSLDSVANAPKVDQQKRKRPFSGSVTSLMEEKFTAHIKKEDCISFFNLCASLPSFILKSEFERQT